ncbi:MAG: hypothetical protein COB59_08985 [Rhodospirillaceae bacterium]|nr:MAG: hypothetical protein COB59_08985 [Rhodospirillaceae bacterium]
MKKTIIIITSILAMAAVQPAMAGEGGHGHMQHGDEQKMQESGHDMSQMKGEHGDMHANSDNMKDHSQMEMPMKMNMASDSKPMKDMFLVKKDIDGYTVSFHAMQVAEGMQHGGSHNVMIKIEKDGKALTKLTANSKVTHPNGKSESKMLMKMGDWYMAGYDLDHTGQHQIMVLFKTADGVKHFGGVHFPKDK